MFCCARRALQGAGEGPGEVGEGRVGRGGGGDRQDVAGYESGGGRHRETRAGGADGEVHRADGGAVLRDREGRGVGGGGAGGAVAAAETGRKIHRGCEDVALDGLRRGGAAGPRAGDIGRALHGAVAGQAVAGRGQAGEALQTLAEDVESRQFDVDRLADEAGGVDVFEQRRVVRAEARETGAGRMRADWRAVNAAAQIGQIVFVGGGQGRGAVGD